MSDKKKGLAIIKRDTLENWNKAQNYIPEKNVFIIVDNEDGTIQMKVGDGKTLVNGLPNLLDNIKEVKNSYVEKEVLAL